MPMIRTPVAPSEGASKSLESASEESPRDERGWCLECSGWGEWQEGFSHMQLCPVCKGHGFKPPVTPVAPSPDWKAIARDLAGALDACTLQLNQMKGMFPGEAREETELALNDADEAINAYHKAMA